MSFSQQHQGDLITNDGLVLHHHCHGISWLIRGEMVKSGNLMAVMSKSQLPSWSTLGLKTTHTLW